MPTVTATAIVPAVPTTPPPATTSSQQVSVSLIAQNSQFDKNTITVPAGASVTIILDNRDRSPHNFALYSDGRTLQVIFKGENVVLRSIQYDFMAPAKPGTYFFRCDNHPEAMKGNFIVK